jgi:hypothetical protein
MYAKIFGEKNFGESGPTLSLSGRGTLADNVRLVHMCGDKAHTDGSGSDCAGLRHGAPSWTRDRARQNGSTDGMIAA